MEPPSYKLLSLDSASLEQSLSHLSTRIAQVEDSIPAHPAFATFAERIAEVETKIASLHLSLSSNSVSASSLPCIAKELQISDDDESRSSVGICLDELRASQMKIKLEHDLRFSTLQLELEKVKRSLGAVPSEADHDVWKQSLMADAILKAKASGAAAEQMTSEKLALHALEAAHWKSDFEASLSKRLDGVVGLIQANAAAIDDVTTATEKRLTQQEEGISVMEQTAQYLRSTTSSIDDDRAAVHSRLEAVEANVHQAVAQCADVMAAVDRQVRANQVILDTVDSVEKKLNQRIADADAKTAATEGVLRGQRHHTELLVQDMRNLLATSMETMDIEARKLNFTIETLTALQTHLSKTDDTVRSHAVALDVLVKHDGMLTQHTLRFAELDRSIAMQVEKDRVRLERLENDYSSLKHHVHETEWVANENNKIFHEQLHQLHQLAKTTESAVATLSGQMPGLQYDVTELSNGVANTRVEMKRVVASSTLVEEQLKDVQHHILDWRGTINVRFDMCEQATREIDSQAKDTSALLDQLAYRLDDERKHTLHNFQAMHHLVDGLIQRDVINDEIRDERLGKWALEIATAGLQQEHFLSHSTVLPDDRKQKVADCIFQATGLLSSDVRHHVSRVTLTEHHVDDATVQALRNAAAVAFGNRVRQHMETMAPTTNRFLIDARDTFVRRVQSCVHLTLSFVGGHHAIAKQKRPPTTATCISDTTSSANQDEPDADASDAKKATGKLRPMTAGSGRVDVKSVIPRRSGTSTMKPKASGEIMHIPPSATGEQFVYRGGFRIPKQAKATTDVEVNTSIRHIDVNLQDKLREEPCLEKVGLRGRCQVYSLLSGIMS
ncbi:hypothetical protein SDRG_14249 [Saprolegnia diclina VS20]|uniref:Uncharacterized protein n=1 Tax=Saprolegnia diclina (strain VS20) TaxID=1156394 RepID=T0R7F6_SAPDV|nr:hypothetical protein SDRG_14249 [Saprolegnia diclina VS20]EQC27973.1 hypothetical protein SDRG_14249 [Saprolegnia diclina VS20]|eukprot:XP_008618586.1 hypothetical protein SDRG_14249 [Saprolegnia diclina VS20]